jgi:hypothetical protein
VLQLVGTLLTTAWRARKDTTAGRAAERGKNESLCITAACAVLETSVLSHLIADLRDGSVSGPALFGLEHIATLGVLPSPEEKMRVAKAWAMRCLELLASMLQFSVVRSIFEAASDN